MYLEHKVIALRAGCVAVIVTNSEAHISTQDVLAYEETDDLDAWRE